MFTFSNHVLAPLRDAVLPKSCLVALCGPAGCGKLSALRQAAGSVCTYDLEKQITASEVRAIYKWLQPQLDQSGKCVWAVKPAAPSDISNTQSACRILYSCSHLHTTSGA